MGHQVTYGRVGGQALPAGVKDIQEKGNKVQRPGEWAWERVEKGMFFWEL